MNKLEFLSQLRQLAGDYAGGETNLACIGSADLAHCVSVLFSRDMQACTRCTHCSGCSDCTHISHSHGCTDCHHSAYCLQCDHCSHSAYLVQCSWCVDCTYCFGCVGLNKKEFHLLNQRYSKDEYFKLTAVLGRELGLKLPGGKKG